MTDQNANSNLRQWLILFLIGVFTAGFWIIDHTPFASSYFEENSIIAETENRTADRIEAVNVITAPVRICLGLLGILFLIIPANEKLKWGGVVTLLMLSFLVYSGSSTLWSINPKVTLQKFMVLAFFSFAAFGLARHFSIKELATIFSCICIAYIFIGLAAEIVLGNFAPHKKHYRFVGTCHPNSLAVYGSFCCLVAISFYGQKPELKKWLVLIFVIGLTTLIMTKSRTTLAGLFFASLVTLILTFKPNNRVLAFSTALMVFVFIGFVLTVSRSNVRAAAAEKLAMGRTKNVSTLTGRLPLWELLMESVEEKPMTGFGYLAYWDKEKIEFLSDQLKWEIPHGHNMYIDVLLDGGGIGLLLFAMSFLAALAMAGSRSIIFTDRSSILIAGFLVFAIVHGFAESLFKLPTFLLFMLVALVIRMAIEPFASRMQQRDLADSISPSSI